MCRRSKPWPHVGPVAAADHCMDHDPGTRRTARKGSPRECDGLWDWNLTSNRIHFSPGWVSLVGGQPHEVGNTPEDWFQRVHLEDSDQLRRDIEAVRAEGCDFDLRYRLRHTDGTCRWMRSRGLVVRNDLGEAIRLTGTQSDVTVETVTDPLTGLPNQLLLRERLAQSIDRAHRHSTFHFALLLIDLRRPPDAEGASGATAADPLLNAVARRLETCLRVPEMMPGHRQNDLVARIEGDLLAVLLDGMEDLSHAPVLAERILEKMLSPFTLSGHEVRLTASIGIAVSATGYTQADDALRDARTALHRAHALGGSHREVFDTGILRSAQTDRRLEGDFDAALQRRDFQLVYQPIVSIDTSQIVGFEVLVRWQHPVLGTIPPLDFIPIAEKTGFIVPLGNWILREACLQLGAWQAHLPVAGDLWMSVNLTHAQSRHPDLIDHIGRALRDSALQPRSLVLELTEGTAMDNPAAVTTLLMQLRAMGVRISIDDFGTGYSSLAYLNQFPVDALKIDRSFVRRLDIDKDTVSIVASTIGMAHRLGLHVVAEGVETEDQLALLRSLHCESAQGYLFAMPVDADAAAELLTTGLPAREERPRRESPAGRARAAAGLPPWLQWTMRPARAALLAAAILAVLIPAGVVALFDAERRAVDASAAVLEDAPDEPDGPDAGTDGGGERDGGAAGTSAQPPADPPAATPPRPMSFSVVHLHRMGSCRGRLTVSRDGVEFVPDHGNDAFVLTHTEFLHTVERVTLTIRASNRTYRFEAGGAAARHEKEAELTRIGETISRFRSR